MTLLKSSTIGKPLEKRRSFGTTVHPRRTPVKPAYFEKDAISIATYIGEKQVRLHTSICMR